MPYVPLAHAIARLGCFLNGCCWGTASNLPWAVQYPRNSWIFRKQLEQGVVEPGALSTIALHPTQLYASASLLFIFFVMRFAYKRNTRTGAVLMLYPLLYGVHRFIIESFRGDSARPLLGLTASQIVALGFIAFAIAGFAMLKTFVWPRENTPPEDNTHNPEMT
jgi:phosphatidylglycerol:prolipoprotein diacylglycerol transferase